jgi:hypothetical protein
MKDSVDALMGMLIDCNYGCIDYGRSHGIN